MHWSEHAQCIGPCYVHEMAYQTGRSLKHGYVIQYSELCKVRDKGQRKGHRSWIDHTDITSQMVETNKS